MAELTPETTIQMTQEEMFRALAREELALNKTFCFVVNEATRSVGNKEGSTIYGVNMIEMSVQALSDPEDPESGFGPPQRASIFIPRLHPEAVGASLPSWVTGLCVQSMQALYGDELASSPKYDKATKTFTLNGEEISRDEANVQYEVAKEEAVQKALEVYNDPTQLQAFVFYGTIELDKDGQYRNIRSLSSACPPDKTLCTDPEEGIEYIRVGKTDTATSKPAKKTSKEKASKKKTSKRK